MQPMQPMQNPRNYPMPQMQPPPMRDKPATAKLKKTQAKPQAQPAKPQAQPAKQSTQTKPFTPPPLPSGTKIVLRWSEEFTGNALDASKWKVTQGDGTDFGIKGWGNQELQCYNADNVKIDPSEKVLIITAQQGGGCINEKDNSLSDVKITSGKIISKKGFMWGGTAGDKSIPVLISARIKVPMAKSSFPAFWLLPMDDAKPWCSGCGKHGGWCTSGEIDIMEHINDEFTTYSTLYYGGTTAVAHESCKNNQKWHKFSESDGPDQWHIYSVLWDSESIRTFVDGELVHSMKAGEWSTASDPNNKYAPFDNEMRIILNLAVGGKWPFSFAPKETLPAALPYKMIVDYVYVHDVVAA